ncbi:LysE family transporter [Micrococcus sp. EYE_162]|uniref:LysE/ArgO family amino acid transporter n=1 Tax=unclassified Micrococcus TaxID=2620948 RepID=UPI002004B181|nr:LysE family transporter [Micrococcus sp. EYE_212]MCK6170995.1 LysE family transporter [Micrococcus sp. EYE_162]
MPIFTTGFLTYLALIVAIGAQTLFLLRQIVRRDRVGVALGVCFASDVALLAVGTAGIGVVAEHHPWIVTALTVSGVVYLLWFAVSAFRSALRGQRTLVAAAAEVDASLAPDAVELATLTGELPRIDPRTGTVAGGHASRRGPESPAAMPAPQPAGAGAVAVKTRVEPRRVMLEAPQSRLGRIVLLSLSVSLLNPHAILDTVVMMGTFAQTYGADKWLYTLGALAASAVWFVVLGWGGTKLAPSMNSPRTWRIVDAVVGTLMLGIAAKVALTLL